MSAPVLDKKALSVIITGVSNSRHFTLSTLHLRVIKVILIGGLALLLLSWAVASYYFNEKNKQLNQEIEAKKQAHIALQTSQNGEKHQQVALAELAEKTKKLKEVYTQVHQKLEKINLNEGIKVFDEKSVFSSIGPLSKKELAYISRVLPLGLPAKKKYRISSHYGPRIHPIRKKKNFHKGIDLAMPLGTPLYATADGVVKFSGVLNGFGTTIKISHEYGFETLLSHLSQLKVKKGTKVKKGQLVGLSGATGQVTAAHLHYEILFNKKAIDPRDFLRWNSSNYKHLFKKNKAVPWVFLINVIKFKNIQKQASSQQDALSKETLK
jgi:murein DD-endopeptidase MepM/ murein hydrolase activator NlpD